MISKYFLWTSVLILNILLFSSCLNSSDNNLLDPPSDPQIYAISLSARTDSNRLLPAVAFTIDQVEGKIYNKNPLPYLFHVDSVKLNIVGSLSYIPFAKIELKLDSGNPYIWNQSDSVAINRLQEIITTAPDGVSSKTYQFRLNIYSEDPNIITWNKVEGDWITLPATAQRTIAYNDQFFTYYLSGTEMKGLSGTSISDPANETEELEWNPINGFSGMPHTIRLSSLITTKDAIYALDDAVPGAVYRSSDGAVWMPLQTEAGYEVTALYGELPFAPGNILLAVNQNGTYKLARANEDFSQISLMGNDVPVNMPVADFSTINVESNSSYASRFIFLSGGIKANGTPNNEVWILQEDNDVITHISSRMQPDITLEGSSLFFYDEKTYLIATSAGKNILMYSENYGATWVKAVENHALPDDNAFTVRKNASVLTDANNNIWILGGVSSSNTQLVDIWRGKLNKFAN